jgi:hypothetical protein
VSALDARFVEVHAGWDSVGSAAPDYPRQARKRSVLATRDREDGIAATQCLLEEACRVLQKTSGMDPRIVARASAWEYKIQNCAQKVWHYRCPSHGTIKTVCSCCSLAICPRNQRRYVGRWIHRANHLVETLGTPRGLRWRMITVSLRQAGDVFERVDKSVKVRAALAKELRDEYGMLAGFGSLEEGEHEGENVHVHFLALSAFAPQAKLKHWLQARDCTVGGCRHTADDRCDLCKSAGRSCPHPHADGRPRCNGSWYVDVRQCYVRRGSGKLRVGTDGKSAVAEAIKYAIKPTLHGNPHRASPAQYREEQAHALRTVRFFAALHGRHRIETYGEAKKVAPGEEEAAEDQEPGKAPVCNECHARMTCIGVGQRTYKGDVYVWTAATHGPSG